MDLKIRFETIKYCYDLILKTNDKDELRFFKFLLNNEIMLYKAEGGKEDVEKYRIK